MKKLIFLFLLVSNMLIAETLPFVKHNIDVNLEATVILAPPSLSPHYFLTQSNAWKELCKGTINQICYDVLNNISNGDTDPQQIARRNYCNRLLYTDHNDIEIQKIVNYLTNVDKIPDLNTDIQTIISNFRDAFSNEFDKLAGVL